MTEIANPHRFEYPFSVAEKSATRRGNRNPKRRTSATRQALFLRLSILNGGRCGAAFRLAGVLFGRYFHPRIVRRHRNEKRRGGFQLKRNPT